MVTSAAFCLKLPVLYLAGFNAFGAIHALYLDIVVILPAAGLLLLLLAWSRRWAGRPRLLTPGSRFTCFAAMAAAPVGVYASLIEPYDLREETLRVVIPAERSGADPVTIAVLSDIQTDRVGEYERFAVDRVMSWRPDMILMPGDLFQGSSESFIQQIPALRDLLSRLSAPGGVYFVLGDVDSQLDLLRRALEGTPVRLLINDVARTKVRDRHVSVGGVELRYGSSPAAATIRQLNDGADEGDVRILLAHRPDVIEAVGPNARIDLIVAGHSHGGQVCIPFLGPPLTLCRVVPRRVAAGGLHVMSGRCIYVSRGVGHERGQAPPIRFLCPPEITLLTLESRE
jgi:predicted MPP superfamily phosphohydrolase